jgi:peptidyl-prolyl cis-trans isomerase B (cyclophilin B)
MKKTLLSLSLIVLSSFIFSACSLFPSKTNSDLDLNSSPTSSVQSQTSPTSFAQNQTGKFAAINTKYGQIVVKLYDTESPKTVANFLSKANSSFYDNLTFHRVEPGFVVQGGDPKGNGTGGVVRLPQRSTIFPLFVVPLELPGVWTKPSATTLSSLSVSLPKPAST